MMVRTNKKNNYYQDRKPEIQKPERLIRLGVFAAVDSYEFMVGKLVRVYDECLGTDRR